MGWIGVDLDGTLAEYHRWEGETVIGKPIVAMVARVRQWRANRQDVRIFTARICSNEDPKGVRKAIEAWSRKHLGEVLPITNVKDYALIELWDDRAVHVIPNTGIPLLPAAKRDEEMLQMANALRPFAMLYQALHHQKDDGHPVFGIDGREITVGDLRNALRHMARVGHIP